MLVSRRSLLVAWAGLAGGCQRRPRGLLLRLPFPAGTVVLCEQGTHSPQGQTHHFPQNRHALDFSSLALDTVPIVAAAPGTVVYAYDKARPDDPDAGMQYGNHVKIAHDESHFTLYAHLDRVSVTEGQRVGWAHPLGTMGSTGLGGTRHLHFALLPTNAPGGGVITTRPITALLAARTDEAMTFRWTTGDAFVSHPTTPWRGGLYGSENTPDTAPHDGAPPPSLHTALRSAHATLRTTLDDRLVTARVAASYADNDAAWAETQLRPVLERDPTDPVALYLRAAAVELPSNRLDDAERTLDAALVTARSPRRFEVWLEPWIHAQRATISLRRGDEGPARERLEQAVRSCQSESVLRTILLHLAPLRRRTAP